jgi:TolB protein
MRTRAFLPALRAAVLAVLAFAAACDLPTRGGGGEPAGSILYRSGGRGWYQVGMDGGPPTPHPWLAPNVQAVAWSPDGERIAFTGFNPAAVFVARADGSGVVQLTDTVDGSTGYAAWSPRGDRISYLDGGLADYGLYLMNHDGTGKQRPQGGDSAFPGASWSPDGTRIVFPKQEHNRHPNGRDIVQATSLFVLDVATGAATRLTTSVFGDDDPDWSPDGSRIVFSRSVVPMRQHLFVINPDGTGLRQLTRSEGWDNKPAWSPDGRWIAFQSTRAGNWDIWVMRADARRLRNLTAGNPEYDVDPVWNPAPRH